MILSPASAVELILLLLARELSQFTSNCNHLPLAECTTLSLGNTTPHLSVCHGCPFITRFNNICVAKSQRPLCSATLRLTVQFDGTCKLCVSGPENVVHFISHCPPSLLCAISSVVAGLPLAYSLTQISSQTTYSALSGLTMLTSREKSWFLYTLSTLSAPIFYQPSTPHRPPSRLLSFSGGYKEEDNWCISNPVPPLCIHTHTPKLH